MKINTSLLAEVLETGYKSAFIKEEIPEKKEKFKILFDRDINIIIDWPSFDNEESIYEAKRVSIYWVEYILSQIIQDDELNYAKEKIRNNFSILEIKDINSIDETQITLLNGKLSFHADWQSHEKDETIFGQLQGLLESEFGQAGKNTDTHPE